jgi:GNAT superfamily N-acetyltransferase
MNIEKTTEHNVYSIKFTIKKEEAVIAWAFLVIIVNDRHAEPYGLMENVYVEPDHRGQGLGTQLVEAVIAEAKERGCYKLIAQSRYEKPEVHKLYEKYGFKDHGKNFRMDLIDSPVKQAD